MIQLKPNYVTDSRNKKIAVQLNIATYKKLEEILENYGLYHLMEEEQSSPLKKDASKAYYDKLKKRK